MSADKSGTSYTDGALLPRLFFARGLLPAAADRSPHAELQPDRRVRDRKCDGKMYFRGRAYIRRSAIDNPLKK